MPPDLLPLDVGNFWRYEVAGSDGTLAGRLEVEITDYIILDGTSMYLFSQFPMAPGGGFSRPVAVRYDTGRNEFMLFDGEAEVELFPLTGATAEILETDDAGAPWTVRFGFGNLALTFERGLGITLATSESTSGPMTARLTGSRIGGLARGDAAGPPAGPGLPIAEPTPTVAEAGDAVPDLELELRSDPAGHRLILHVRNPTDRLMALDFSSSQSFDFVVMEQGSGREIWRWSEKMFFSQVLRSEALRAGEEWTFEEVWNHRDRDYEPVPSGRYEVQAVLTSVPPLRSAPALLDLP